METIGASVGTVRFDGVRVPALSALIGHRARFDRRCRCWMCSASTWRRRRLGFAAVRWTRLFGRVAGASVQGALLFDLADGAGAYRGYGLKVMWRPAVYARHGPRMQALRRVSAMAGDWSFIATDEAQKVIAWPCTTCGERCAIGGVVEGLYAR